MSYLINSKSSDGKMIDASGQQVMLSRQIALYAIYYQTRELENSINQMESNHQFLLSLPMSEDFVQIYLSYGNDLRFFRQNKRKMHSVRKRYRGLP
jgi:hypothetical protein